LTPAQLGRTLPAAHDVWAGDGSVSTTAAALDTTRSDLAMTTVSVQPTAPEIQPRHKPTVSEYQHRCRDLLGRIAGEPVAAVPVAASADDIGDHPDAELLRLGAECLCALREWEGVDVENDEATQICQDRYYAALESFRDLPATTVAGIAMHLRLHFAEQCTKPWNFQATLAMELTPEQVEEIDGADLAIFRLAQTAMRIAAAGRA